MMRRCGRSQLHRDAGNEHGYRIAQSASGTDVAGEIVNSDGRTFPFVSLPE